MNSWSLARIAVRCSRGTNLSRKSWTHCWICTVQLSRVERAAGVEFERVPWTPFGRAWSWSVMMTDSVELYRQISGFQNSCAKRNLDVWLSCLNGSKERNS